MPLSSNVVKLVNKSSVDSFVSFCMQSKLLGSISIADNIILSYQQAYATIYANALGVRVEDVPITASTTVDQLQKLITSNSVTSNNQIAEIYPEDVVVDDEYDADLVTM